MSIQIVVVRHPEKDGDKITAYGAQQAWAAALALGERFKFYRLVHSGLNRARQTSQVMAVALGLSLQIHRRPFLNFTDTLAKTVGDSASFFAEVKAMKEKEGVETLTVAMALQHSYYARLGSVTMSEGLLTLAHDMRSQSQTTALAISHSPWLELAAPNTEAMPYGVGEADAVVYVIENDKIISSELIRAPLPGKPLV